MSDRAEAAAKIEAARADKSKPYFPPGLGDGKYTKDGEATATCFCGEIQIAFPTEQPGFLGSGVCHCCDCRKTSSSTFNHGFTVMNSHLKYLRGEDKVKVYTQNKTTNSGKNLSNHFCSNCGTLLFLRSEAHPGGSAIRAGIVDDFNLVDTKLRPQAEIFTEYRAEWLGGPIVRNGKQIVGPLL